MAMTGSSIQSVGTASLPAAMGAILLRELHAAFLNRYLQVFCLLALAGGIGAAFFPETGDGAPLLLLQMTLYFVSLFAVLIGTSSARAESQEWPLLFAAPIPRSTLLLGKFFGLTLTFAGLLALCFVPTLFVRSIDATLLFLYGHALTVAATFVALGLAAGFLARDRVQGLVVAVTAWLFFLFGLDSLALVLAHFSFLQRTPDLWAALLMLNPLDAFRINALFALERIPAEGASQSGLTSLWLAHSGTWFVIISLAWMIGLLGFTAQRLNRWEE
jgi:ABC-type transport system involved in multi-copper enzyme maturation permease subunit